MWKAGPETYAHTGRTDVVVGGLPELRPLPDEEALVAYARAAREVWAPSSLFDLYTNAFENLDLLVGAAIEGLGLEPGDLERAFTTDPLTLR